MRSGALRVRWNISQSCTSFVKSFLRIKTTTKNGKKYKYLVRQTNVRKGKKVHSIMEHICGFGMAVLSPGKPGGFSGDRPTDKRQIRDQESYNRERFKKEMEHPRERFMREAAKAAAARSTKAEEPDKETMEAVWEFNEARAKEK
jgi:hypothetical protein